MLSVLVLLLLSASAQQNDPISNNRIDRQSLIRHFNPTRSNNNTFPLPKALTPMHIGNGNFAFGADLTGLQTLLPFNTLSSWAWKNDTFPPGKTLADIEQYRGVSWLNHGRLVEYDFGGATGGGGVEQWLIANPNRVNLGRVGLVFWAGTESGGVVPPLNVSESDFTDARQELDLWTGKLTSRFRFQGVPVTVETAIAGKTSSIGIRVQSPLLQQQQQQQSRLGIFLDFPWNDGKAKFSAPFVGNWDAVGNHTTELVRIGATTKIVHTMDKAVFDTHVHGDEFAISRDSPTIHRYTLRPLTRHSASFSTVVSYSNGDDAAAPSEEITSLDVFTDSADAWERYWTQSGFVDVMTGSTDPRAEELQRRIILSRYLMRVNEVGDTPPQESGLVNNGWYGKFHMEMYFWHSAHWALWNNWDILSHSSSIYSRFLNTSIARAQTQQGWSAGARWPKMTDPSGRSSPGQINNLLIWQQPHPLIFAQYEYRAFPTRGTLEKWKEVVRETADWMAAFAWFNETTGVYDLGPPMYVVSEDTSPNVTQNPALELAYWRLGLGIASRWMENLDEDVPEEWTRVVNNLAKLPVDNGTYAVYEGIESNFWDDPEYTSDHPALVGLHGWLPPTPGLDITMATVTAEKVWTHWNITECWGWDFPMLAMSAARMGNQEKAIEWLLHPLFVFDDVGMPVGGVRVPTPYFPGSGALLLAVAMMTAGWDGSKGRAPGFPKDGWDVRVEGISRAL